MDYTIAMGAWAVTIAAPCIASWLAGDMSGAARTRRSAEQTDRQDTGTNAPAGDVWWFASEGSPPQSDWSAPARKVAAQAWPVLEPSSSMTSSLSIEEIEEKVRQAEERHRQRRALMPGRKDPAVLDEGLPDCEHGDAPGHTGHCALTAMSATDDPEVRRVLRHYDCSIRALEQARMSQRAEGLTASEVAGFARDVTLIVTQVPGWQRALERSR